MSSLPAINLTRPALHFPLRTILAVAVSIVAASLPIAVTTATVLGRDLSLYRAADDATSITVPCNLAVHRDV